VRKYPAVIWLFGGFDNGIGDTAWAPAEPDNDQSARALWQSGLAVMYPSLRGGNQNPGSKEGFYGEVDDVLAAADWLASQTYVDPQRIYLGGHSTGGTLALLTAACSDRFRAVFAFGPVADVSVYGQENLPFDINNAQEVKLRSPIQWLRGIKSPTFVFEGSRGGNVDDVQAMRSITPSVVCQIVDGHDHFSLLAQVTPRIAAAILADRGPAFDVESLRIGR
jgi:dipeptidyl aminopeptidase/acylaminoacyl peptidase